MSNNISFIQRAKQVSARTAADWLGIKINRGGFGSCPCHKDKTPSVKFYPDGHAHCYSCGRSFDAAGLVAAVRGCSEFEGALIVCREFKVYDTRPTPSCIVSPTHEHTTEDQEKKHMEKMQFTVALVAETVNKAHLDRFTQEQADSEEFSRTLAAYGIAQDIVDNLS